MPIFVTPKQLQAEIDARRKGDADNATAIRLLSDRVKKLESAPPVVTPPVVTPPVVTPPVEPPTTGVPAGVRLTEPDGGSAYYGKFSSPHLPTDLGFFPIGVWVEQAQAASEIEENKSAGVNTFVGYYQNPPLKLISAAGMNVMTDGGPSGAGHVGYMGPDEPDMVGSAWGAPTPAQFAALAKSIDSLPKTGQHRFTNFGKGIVFSQNDAEAARMLRNYQDIISTDIYWFTDGYVQGANEGGKFFGVDNRDLTTAEARRASNYGAVIRRVRTLLANSKPTWGFVELGGPFSFNTPDGPLPYITAAQIRAAVWHSIIAGARGITYFNHTFGGDGGTDHILRQMPYYQNIRTAVTSLNAQIQSLAPALNGPTADGLISNSPTVHATAWWNSGKPVVVAASKENVASNATFVVTGRKTGVVTVIGENRTLELVNGTFSDKFSDGNAVHIYQL